MLHRSVVISEIHDHKFGQEDPPKVSLSAMKRKPLKIVRLSWADFVDI
jgi:hypothetical protein